ncbi:MAG: glycerol-3-phosphate dehydrogenase/oxidase [Acidimicrobiia bacterium]
MTRSREIALSRLADEHFDVLVVGGGITGAGVALDAVTRGLRTALVERHDFASGTSSKSSKFVHGGVRYLEQREFRLVYEALAERQVLLRNAPHLVRVLPFVLPVYARGGVVPRKLSRALGTAMWLYDLTGGARIGRRHQRLAVDEARSLIPTLRPEGLAPSYLFYDAQADDARLTLTVVMTAADLGAAVANHAEVVGLRRSGDRVVGADVVADGSEIPVAASVVVNAGGVWSDRVRSLEDGADPGDLRPAKGIHVAVPWGRVRNSVGSIIPVRGDRRSIFVAPWGDVAYFGTTDTDYDGPLDDPPCTPDDVDYLLSAANGLLDVDLDRSDIVGSWAGLRPLLHGAGSERTADLSRRHAVHESAAGVITVTGGKLTTYRRMASDVVDRIMTRLDRRGRCRTRTLRLAGAEGIRRSSPGPEPGTADHLLGRYGSGAGAITELVTADPELGRPLVEGLPYLRAEAVHAVRDEYARTLDDILSRRTRARLFGRDASARAAPDVAVLVAPELGWDAGDVEREVADYRASVAAERDAAGLPETPSTTVDQALTATS